jgi:hypothetical protein
VDSLKKALANEQREHAITKKANIALNDKYCVLVEKHNKLEEQYSLLWESTPQPSKAMDNCTPSTSQGCEKCYNLDSNVYSTNLANMEAMKREIARINEIVNKGCMNKSASGKENQPKMPQFKNGRKPHIKDRHGHIKGSKTNGRNLVNGYECVQFISRGKIGTEKSAQKVAQQPRTVGPAMGNSAAVVRGGSVAPIKKGRLPLFPLLMTSPRRRSISQSRWPKNQRNQSRALQINMSINLKLKCLVNV